MQVCDSKRKPVERGLGHNRAQRARLGEARLSSLCHREGACLRDTAQRHSKGHVDNGRKKSQKHHLYLALILPLTDLMCPSVIESVSLLLGCSDKYKLTGAIGKPFKSIFFSISASHAVTNGYFFQLRAYFT